MSLFRLTSFAWLMLCVLGLFPAGAQQPKPKSREQPQRPVEEDPADRLLVRRQWTIQGRARDALVYIPPRTREQPAPVIFAFHGHGGDSRKAVRMFHCHRLWPEAIVVYPQGLNTPSAADPGGRRSGWQSAPGDQADRDLAFFDAVLSTLRQEQKVDDRRIFATGHSNGGAFVYVLWAERGKELAAVAPSGYARRDESWRKLLQSLAPKRAMHIAGRQDPLVPFDLQEQTIQHLRTLNQCGEGRARGEFVTWYASSLDAPVATFLHPGGHAFPERAAPAVVRFFRGFEPPLRP